jgi:hypothetical protein
MCRNRPRPCRCPASTTDPPCSVLAGTGTRSVRVAGPTRRRRRVDDSIAIRLDPARRHPPCGLRRVRVPERASPYAGACGASYPIQKKRGRTSPDIRPPGFPRERLASPCSKSGRRRAPAPLGCRRIVAGSVPSPVVERRRQYSTVAVTVSVYRPVLAGPWDGTRPYTVSVCIVPPSLPLPCATPPVVPLPHRVTRAGSR